MFDKRTMVTAAILAFCVSAPADSGPTVPFPTDYRRWPVTRTMLIGPESKDFAKSGGLHHYYANESAMEGFRTGKFPRGSVIVDERLQIREVGGVTLEGERLASQ